MVLAVCNQGGNASSICAEDDRSGAGCLQPVRVGASAALKDDRELVLAVYSGTGGHRACIGCAKDDREVVLAVCNQYGWALEHASAALKDDREVVLAACNQSGRAEFHRLGTGRPRDRDGCLQPEPPIMFASDGTGTMNCPREVDHGEAQDGHGDLEGDLFLRLDTDSGVASTCTQAHSRGLVDWLID